MFLYQILAFSEADHKVCFMEYHCCPAGVPDTPEEAVKYALKWHSTLGIAKHMDVRFWVARIDAQSFERVIIEGIGDQSIPVTLSVVGEASDKPFNDSSVFASDQITARVVSTTPMVAEDHVIEFSLPESEAPAFIINHEGKAIPTPPEFMASKPRNKGGRPKKNRKSK